VTIFERKVERREIINWNNIGEREGMIARCGK
jgi:hypothetical protein